MDVNKFDREWKISELGAALIMAGWPSPYHVTHYFPTEPYDEKSDSRSPRVIAATSWEKFWNEFVAYVLDNNKSKQAAHLGGIAHEDYLTAMDLLGYELDFVDMKPHKGLHVKVNRLREIPTLDKEPKRVAKDGKIVPKKDKP